MKLFAIIIISVLAVILGSYGLFVHSKTSLPVELTEVESPGELAQTSSTSLQPKWQTLVIEEDGSMHQVDATSVTKPNANGTFKFVARSVFVKPTKIEISPGNIIGPVVGVLMLAEASCKTRRSVIRQDVMLTADGKYIGQNALSSVDKMSIPEEKSVHGVMIDLVCGDPIRI